MSKGLLRATALVLLGTASPAFADDIDPFSLSPEQLFDATVMSVSRADEKLRAAPAAVYVLTNEDIRRSGATSIPEALRLVPGVQVARSSTSGWAISVRGFNSSLANKLLVLMDGREVYDALFSGVYWDIQDTALEDIERIEVIRGPGASLWGANAVNGVINIITKKAGDTQGAMAMVVVGNQDRVILTGRYGGSIGETGHWRIYGKSLDRAPEELGDGSDAKDAWQALRGGFRTDWDEDVQGNSFTLQGDVYHNEDGNLRGVPQLTPPYSVVNEDNITAEGGNVSGRWTRGFKDNGQLTVQAYLDLTRRGQLSLGDKRTTFDIDAQYRLPAWRRHDLIAGVRYRLSDEELTPSAIITFADGKRHDQLFSGFIQDKIALESDRWYLTLGSKFEHNDYTGFEVQPNVRAEWLGDAQTAWASVSRAVRTPDQLEQDLNVLTGVIPPGFFPVPISVELRPNPDFKSEELIAYELGYRRQWSPTVQMDLAVFYNDYDNLSTITLLPPEVGFPPLHLILPVETTNDTTAQTYGFEAVVNWRAQDNLNVSAAYSLLEMDLDGPPSNKAIASEAAEGQSPEQQFNVRAQWDVSKQVAWDTTLYYVGALPALDIDAYWRLDTRVGFHIADNLEVELIGQDLLDDSHREFGSTQIQRSLFARLTWRQ
jgi:iron complex outermembrane receptor protein